MKKTFLHFVGVASFLLMSAGLWAMENDSFARPHEGEIQGRAACVRHLQDTLFSPIGELQLETEHTIEGRKYSYKGYDAGLDGHLFHKLDDEQLILNQDNQGKWFITHECRKSEGTFTPAIGDTFSAMPVTQAPYRLRPPTLKKCLLQNAKKYGTPCALALVTLLLLRWYLKPRKKGPLLRIDPKTHKIWVQKTGNVRIRQNVSPE